MTTRLQQETSLEAYQAHRDSGARLRFRQKVLRAFYLRWLADPVEPGATDEQIEQDLVDVNEDGSIWRPKSSSVTGGRGSWVACAGRRKDCDEAHQPGQTHDGETPYLRDSGSRRPPQPAAWQSSGSRPITPSNNSDVSPNETATNQQEAETVKNPIAERVRSQFVVIRTVAELPPPEDRGDTTYFLSEPWEANGYAGPAESRWKWREALAAGELVVDRLWTESKTFVASNAAHPDAGVCYLREADLKEAIEATGEVLAQVEVDRHCPHETGECW